MNFNINKHIIFPLVATILCMLAIFILSAQPATKSNTNSKMVLNQIVDTTMKLGGSDITEQQKTELVDKVNSVARELMHAAVYFVMAIFLQITILGIFRRKLLSMFITFTFCVAYGISDEIHQLFIPGRTFQLIDLVMDTGGASAAIVLVVLVYIIRKNLDVQQQRKIR